MRDATSKLLAGASALFSSSSDGGRVSRRILALVVLLGCLLFALTQPPQVDAAAPCCQTCLHEFAVCENACAVQCGGTNNTCFTDCWDVCYYGYRGFTSCGGSCVWCSQGGGGGGDSVFSCSFDGPTYYPDPGGWLNSISCTNYNATCFTYSGGGRYCCDSYGCYYP